VSHNEDSLKWYWANRDEVNRKKREKTTERRKLEGRRTNEEWNEHHRNMGIAKEMIRRRANGEDVYFSVTIQNYIGLIMQQRRCHAKTANASRDRKRKEKIASELYVKSKIEEALASPEASDETKKELNEYLQDTKKRRKRTAFVPAFVPCVPINLMDDPDW
jgi:hypothetical protein